MSVLDRLDATRLCGRWSAPLQDPGAWARPTPVRRPAAVVVQQPYSWLALARNPNALVLTGMIGSVVVKDAVLRLLDVWQP